MKEIFSLDRPRRQAIMVVFASLIFLSVPASAMGLPPAPEELAILDIVSLRSYYRSALGITRFSNGAEIFEDDGGADLDAAVADIRDMGIEVIETYGSFVLARVDSSTAAYLESIGIAVEEIPQRTRIAVGSYQFDTRDGEPPLPSALRSPPLTDDDVGDFIIQFIGPQKVSWIDQVMNAGANIKGRVGPFSIVVEANSTEISKVQGLNTIEWTGPFHPAYRIASGLLETSGNLNATVLLFPSEDTGRLAEFIVERGGQLKSVWREGANAEISSDLLVALSHLPQVSWIEPSRSPAFLNEEATWILQSAIPDTRSIFAYGIEGQGQLVTIADSGIKIVNEGGGIDADHEVFKDPNTVIGDTHRKVRAYEPFNNNQLGDEIGHGTHIAGTLAGDAPSYGTYNLHDGHAFQSWLYFQDIASSAVPNPPLNRKDLFSAALDKDSSIHSNSYGRFDFVPGTSPYSTFAQQIDDFMWDFDHFIIVFAAGDHAIIGAGGPQPETLTWEAQAKNAVIVGSTGSYFNDVWEHSSRGPTDDGRISPTVVAPGYCINSARADATVGGSEGCSSPSTYYVEQSGTSSATAAIAGSLALIRQYLEDGWYPTGLAVAGHAVIQPKAAVLKALLVNSGDQLTGSGAFEQLNEFPNPDQGWGRPVLDRVLYFLGDARRTGWRYISSGLSQGEALHFKVSVGSANTPLNIALVWTDPFGDFSCEDCLVNDLDLQVQDPGGFWYHGNLYECQIAGVGTYQSCGYSYTWQLTPDRKNNVETVYRDIPASGEWTIRVMAPFIGQGPQPFALVVTGADLSQDLSGEARASATNDLLPNVKVTLSGVSNTYTTTTDSNGQFSIAAAPGLYTLTAERCDYGPLTMSVSVDPGFLREETLLLDDRLTGTIFGYVKNEFGSPLADAKVQEQCTYTSTFTSSTGYYTLAIPGDYLIVVKATKSGYVGDVRTVNVAIGGSKNVDFVLEDPPYF